MNRLFLIFFNTVLEVRRHRPGGALVLVSGFMILGGFLWGSLSVAEPDRLSINFALTTSHISLMLMALFLSSRLMAYERENKTFLTLFVRPLSGGEFLGGRFLGLVAVLSGGVLVLQLVVAGLFWFYGSPLDLKIWGWGTGGLFLESLILVSLSLALSFFISSPFLVFLMSVFCFVIGHGVNEAGFLLHQDPSGGWGKSLLQGVFYGVVDLQRLNFRKALLYQDPVSFKEGGLAVIYALLWVVLFLTLARGGLEKLRREG